MANANTFASLLLHPGSHVYDASIGGNALIKFGPAPADVGFLYSFKINMPQADIVPLILWNPRVWNTNLTATLNFSRDSLGSTLYHSFTGAISGKFTYAYSRMYPDYLAQPEQGIIRSTNAEPRQKASGVCDSYNLVTAETDHNYQSYYVLPEARLNMVGNNDSATLDQLVFDINAVQSGNYSSSASISSIRNGNPILTISGVIQVTVYEIYLRDDGTADVIAYIECGVFGGGSVVLYQEVPDGYSDLGAYTISFLGQNVDCHLAIAGAIPAGMNISQFDLTYEVEVTERWLYEQA